MSNARFFVRTLERLGSVVLVSAAVGLLPACLSGDGADLESIRIEPSSLAIDVNDQEDLRVILQYDDGFEESVTSDIEWTSSAATIAAVDSDGTLRGEAIGNVQISAAYKGLTSSISVDVAGVPKVLRVQAPASNLAIGLTQPYTAELEYRHGERELVTSEVMWTSSATGIADIDKDGVARGVSLGQAVISATGFGLSATRNLDVKAAVVASLVVAPATVSLPVGEQQDLSATCTFSDGNVVAACRVIWESSNPAIAKIDSNGRVTALAPGDIVLTARQGIARLTIMATVLPANPS